MTVALLVALSGCGPVAPGTFTLTVDDPEGLVEQAGSQAIILTSSDANGDYAVVDRIPDPETTTWAPVVGPGGELRVFRNVHLAEGIAVEATWVLLRHDWWHYFVREDKEGYVDLFLRDEIIGAARSGTFVLTRGEHETGSATVEAATNWLGLTKLGPEDGYPLMGWSPDLAGVWKDGPEPSWLDVEISP